MSSSPTNNEDTVGRVVKQGTHVMEYYDTHHCRIEHADLGKPTYARISESPLSENYITL
jgi:hypothetical protein